MIISDFCKGLTPYKYGEQPRDKNYIKLNTNENAYSCSKDVINTMREFNIDELRLYPDPTCKNLSEVIAKKEKVKQENVFIGNGSDEVLAFVFRAFYAQKPTLFADITYSFYPVYCKLWQISYREIKLKENFTLNIDDYINTPSGMIIICNPNAPTGISIPLEDIEKIAINKPKSMIVIDEAYIDFSEESAISLVNKYNNILVVKTLSKGYSLAGIRLGYAIGSKSAIEALETIKNSFNSYPIDRLAQKVSIAALKDELYFKANIDKIKTSRKYTKQKLEQLGFNVLNSSANFLFAESKDISGENLYIQLKEKGILVRHFKNDRISNFIRITIGKQFEMEIFIKILTQLLEIKNEDII